MRAIILSIAAALAAFVPTGGAAAASSIRDIIEMPRLANPALSPDGRWVAYRKQRPSIDRNSHMFSWWVMPSDGSAPPRRLGDAGVGDWLNGTVSGEAAIWAPDSRSIYYRVAHEGEAQIWQARIDGSSTRAVTAEPGNVARIQGAQSGTALLYSVGPSRDTIERAERAAYDEGVLIDATIDPSRPLIGGSWIDGAWGSERLEGAWFGHAGLLGSVPRGFRHLDLVTGAIREVPLAPTGEAEGLKPFETFEKLDGRLIDVRAPSGDQRGVAYVLTQEGGAYQLIVRSAQGDARCTDPLCAQGRMAGLAWAGDRNALLFTRWDKAARRTSLYRWTVGAPAVERLIEVDGALGNGRGDGCSIGDRLAICVREHTDTPPSIVAIDLATRKIRTLVQTPDPLDPAEPRFAPIEWRDSTGRPFTGLLALPVDAKGPVPLFITYYNCDGFLRGGTGDDFPLRQMAARGIAALCINGYMVPGRKRVGIRNYRIAMDSVGKVIDLLVGRGLVDRTRVGMGGVSFGGEVAVWIASHSTLLRAISAANVLLTPTYYWFNAVEGRDVTSMLRDYWDVGDPDGDRRTWSEVSLAYLAPHFHGALLMQVPEQEYRPNVEILARMQRAGVPAELWGFPGEAHIKWQPRHQLVANARNLDWFLFWLKGEVDPDPAKAAQYDRWRSYPSPSQERAQPSASMIGSRR
ncbi:Atxe2 family lasso peptide isopeptidase [Rhizorhabdus sp. FW153]|uniref:Atxe2 family lasso peptide isopeptidase n=1 Tax=Rhizorhabdus sp. FW153 TaxID=3400216 RepID=UPI003CF3861A